MRHGESASAGLPLYHNWKGSGNSLFHVFFAGIVIPLKDCEGLVAGNRHDAFVIPTFADLSGNKGVTNVVEAEVFYFGILAGSPKCSLPSLAHRSATPGKGMATNGGHLSGRRRNRLRAPPALFRGSGRKGQVKEN